MYAGSRTPAVKKANFPLKSAYGGIPAGGILLAAG